VADRALIGRPYTFQILFVNGNSVPVVPSNPEITIFYYDKDSLKTTLVTAPLISSTPPEVGRYIYPWSIPTNFVDGDVVYAEMVGIDPGTNIKIMVEQTLNLAIPPIASGMHVRFVK